MQSLSNRSASICLSLLLLFAVGCASNAVSSDEDFRDPRDPWENMNRRIFAFNDVADRYVLKPVAEGYQTITPSFLERGIGNMFNNLQEVLNFFSDTAQLKFAAAGKDASRFVINSTVGLFGFFDVAGNIGLSRRTEDLGQALGYWGVGPGPYVVLPFLGSSTVRDASASLVDTYADPIRYISHVPTRNQITVMRLLDIRVGLLASEGLISGDRYTFIRDAYLQRREYLIQDGQAADDDFGGEDFDDWDW